MWKRKIYLMQGMATSWAYTMIYPQESLALLAWVLPVAHTVLLLDEFQTVQYHT
jgi:hypothetical protein